MNRNLVVSGLLAVALLKMTGAAEETRTVYRMGEPAINVAVDTAETRGGLSFVARRELATGVSPVSVAVGRFNADLNADLAVVNRDSNSVSIFFGSSDGTFQEGPVVPVGPRPQSVVAGFFNLDRYMDLAVTNQGDDTVSILLGQSDGVFSSMTAASGHLPGPIAAGDFNGDRHLDLAITNFVTSSPPIPGTISILLGRGDGTFESAPALAVGFNPRALTVGDFNADANLDLAIANSGENTVSIFLGAGTGIFQVRGTLRVGSDPSGIAAGDLNGDGRMDLAVTNSFPFSEPGVVSVLLGVGDGTFNPAPSPLTGKEPIGIAMADFNRDGWLDLVTSNLAESTVSMLLGRGDGTFQDAVGVAVGLGPIGLAVSDFNLDGRLDLTTANLFGFTASVLLGKGDGSFRTAPANRVGCCPSSISDGDFNEDGYDDLVVTNFPDSTISLLLGQRDLTFQAAPPVSVPNYPWSVAVADFNHDQHLDLAITNQNIGGSGSTISIVPGIGNGKFGNPVILSIPAPTAVVAADFDHDGWADLAVTNNFSSNSLSTVTILLNRNFTFQVSTLTVGRNPLDIKLADLNHDGHADLVVANTFQNNTSQPGSISVLMGRGDGSFAVLPELIVGERPISVVVGEWDEDLREDIAVINQFANPPMSILLGNGDGTFHAGPPVPINGYSLVSGDFNRDGHADLVLATPGNYVNILLGTGVGTFEPSLRLGVGWHARALITRDFDSDGFPDIATADYDARTVSILKNNSRIGR